MVEMHVWVFYFAYSSRTIKLAACKKKADGSRACVYISHTVTKSVTQSQEITTPRPIDRYGEVNAIEHHTVCLSR